MNDVTQPNAIAKKQNVTAYFGHLIIGIRRKKDIYSYHYELFDSDIQTRLMRKCIK